MDERTLANWMVGFTKAAADAGITDPKEVDMLVKLCGRMAVRAQNPEAFDEGVAKVAEAAGLEKTAIPWGLIAAAIPAAYGLVAGARDIPHGLKLWRRDPATIKGDYAKAMGPMAQQITEANSMRDMIRGSAQSLGGGGGGYRPFFAPSTLSYGAPSYM